MEWNYQELQLLHSFKNSECTNNWENLTKQLQMKGFLKNQMECKRKWMQLYNEDPNDSAWTQEELHTLFTLYHTYNSQWSNIHKSISSKNKIQIRNKFYGTLRNLIRFLLQYFNIRSGETTTISNKIKPIILQKIYNSSEEFQFARGIVKNVLFSMNFIIDKESLIPYVSENEQLFLKIVSTILKRKIKPKRTSGKPLMQSTKNIKCQPLQNKVSLIPKECSVVAKQEDINDNPLEFEQQAHGNTWINPIVYYPLQLTWVFGFPNQAPDYHY